jgi:phage terminase large subunit-like protein
MPNITLDKIGIPKNLITGNMLAMGQFLDLRFRWANFHRKIANALMDKTKTRIIISVPPQHGKSTLACVFYPLWELGNNPDLNIVVATYAAELGERHSFKTMNYFQSPTYKNLFGLEIDPRECNKGHWQIKGHHGSYSAVGIGGALTGTPADIAIVDDYFSNFKTANSETMQKTVINWYQTVFRTRLQSEESKIIVIATRWGTQDLIAHLLEADEEKKKWEQLIFPALSDYKGNDYFTGKPLWKSIDFYKDQIGLDGMSKIEFQTMYQCEPTPRGDIMLSEDDWQIVPRLPEGIASKRMRGHDIAYTGTSSSDDSANALLVRVGQEVFLCDANSWVAPWHVTKQKEKEIIRSDDPGVVQWFETNGGQSAIVDDLKRDTDLIGHPIHGSESKEKKQVRALPWMLRVKGGQIKMVDGPHKKVVFDQCNHFRASGDAKYDGVIDAISKAWEGMGNTVDLSGWLKS